MTKRGVNLTRKKFNQFIKEGRGQGEGVFYKPWIRITDVASSGFSTMYKSMTVGRVHHVLSNGELSLLYMYDWSSKVKDIREQFPLLDKNKDIIEVKEIADFINVKYSKRNNKDQIYVPTTDFLLTVEENGNTYLEAKTYKYARELENKRTIEKLQIEQYYWERRNVKWGIVTEDSIDNVYVNNIRYFTPYWSLEHYQISEELQEQIKVELIDVFLKNECDYEYEFSKIDNKFNVNRGTTLMVFKNLVCTKQVRVNMHQEIRRVNNIEIIDMERIRVNK